MWSGWKVPKEIQIFDAVTLLYNLGMAPRFRLTTLLQQKRELAIIQFEDTLERITKTKSENHFALENLEISKKVFREEIEDNVRQYCWHQIRLFEKSKLETILKHYDFLLNLLQSHAKHDLYPFIPEFYLETVIDSFHALRRADPPFLFADNPQHRSILQLFISFSITGLQDSRIINPDTKDSLLQTLSALLQYKEFINVFEENDVAKENLFKCLFTSFESGLWINSPLIGLPFWKGLGFGEITEPDFYSSPLFRKLFSESATKEPEIFAKFLNKLFNHLNLIETEFGVSLKEIQSTSTQVLSESSPQFIRSVRLFELSVDLLKLFEVVTREIPEAFSDKQEVNLARLCEVIIMAIFRTTAGSEAELLNSIFRLKISALEKINRHKMLAPIFGIFLALLKNLGLDDPESVSKSKVMKILKSLLSQSTAPFDFLLNEFNFSEYSNVSSEDIARLKKIFAEIIKTEKKSEDSTENQDDLCPICYADSITTKFIPCGHESCNRCISRHLLNDKDCFFCKTKIVKLVRLDTDEEVDVVKS